MTWWETILAVIVGIPTGALSLYLAAYSISYGWHYGRIKAVEIHFLKKLHPEPQTNPNRKDN